MMGFAVVVGETIALRGGFEPRSAALGYLTGFFLTAASMVINDYYDLEIDRINNPKRPLPAGIVSLTEAKFFALLCVVAGLIAAFSINLPSLAVAALATLSMLGYNAKLKPTGLLGNGIVSANVAVPFVYGGFAVNSLAPSLLVFALLAFLSSLGREVTKGIVDVPGDSKRGIRTVAARYGATNAARLAVCLYVAAVSLSVLPIALDTVSALYLLFVLASDAGFLLSSASLVRDSSVSNSRRVKTRVLLWMTLGLLAFLAGAFGKPVFIL